MPKLKLRFTETAQRDLSEIFEFIARRDPGAARSVIDAIERSINLLAEFPLSARRTDMKNVRVRPVARYPFLIFYQADDEFLTVIRIWHSSRDWPEKTNV
jgi:toxin ParE1/3/4